MIYMFIFILGMILGAVIFLLIHWMKRKETKALAQELVAQAQAEKIQDREILLERIKDAFGALSLEALSKNTQEFLRISQELFSKQTEIGEKELEGKRRLIDRSVAEVKERLDKVQEIITQFEKDREQKFGQISHEIRYTAEQAAKLQETTNQLRQALASTKVRGQWGERMAEDVLRLAGFIEGINYLKQKALEAANTRPDYTFNLPQGRKLNMDVKFPLDNYLRYLEAENETEKESCKSQFLRDVRARIKEVTTRDYINPEENTLDYVLVFIPNEQVYAFINENDRSLLDEALKSKVILCSPITLYAILAIVRQAMENFSMERTAGQILSLMGSFAKQWTEFLRSLERMGKKIDEAQEEFQKLSTTRRKQLERPLRQIEELRKERGLEPEPAMLEAELVEPEKIEEVLLEESESSNRPNSDS